MNIKEASQTHLQESWLSQETQSGNPTLQETLQEESRAVGAGSQRAGNQHLGKCSASGTICNQQLRAAGGSLGATKAELESAQQGSRAAVGTDAWGAVAVLFAELHQQRKGSTGFWMALGAGCWSCTAPWAEVMRWMHREAVCRQLNKFPEFPMEYRTIQNTAGVRGNHRRNNKENKKLLLQICVNKW